MSLKIPQFQSASVNGQESQSGSPANAMLNGAGTGAIVGYLFGGSGKGTSAQDLLKRYGGEKADEFIKSIPNFETLSAEEKAKFNYIKKLLAYKNTSVQELEEATKKLFSKRSKVTLRQYILKVPIKQAYKKLDLIGRSSHVRLGMALTATTIFAICNPWSLLIAIPAVGGMNYYKYKHPNFRLGGYIPQFAIMERKAAFKARKSVAKAGSEARTNTLITRLLKLKGIRTFFNALNMEFYKLKYTDEITLETAQKLIKEAKEASDKTILTEIEENMQGLSKYFKKGSNLKNIGIGALVGALAFGALALAGKKVQKNQEK